MSTAGFRIDPDAHPDPDELESLEELLEALGQLLGGALSQDFALAPDEQGLSRSWLGLALRRAGDLQGNHQFRGSARWSRERRLVAALNALDVKDIHRVLDRRFPSGSRDDLSGVARDRRKIRVAYSSVPTYVGDAYIRPYIFLRSAAGQTPLCQSCDFITTRPAFVPSNWRCSLNK